MAGLSSSTGAARLSPARPRQDALELAIEAVSGATRQTALAASRVETRTSLTLSPSACLNRAASVATAASGAASTLAAASTSATLSRSAAPWVTEWNGLPSKPSAVLTQNASTGSESISTSMPRRRNLPDAGCRIVASLSPSA